MEVWGSELRSSGLRGSTLTSGPPPSPLMLPSAPPISLIVIGEPGLLDPRSWALHLKIYSNIVASQIQSSMWAREFCLGRFYKLTHLWGWCLDLVYLGTLHLPLFPRLRCSDQSPSAISVLLAKSTGYCLLCVCVCGEGMCVDVHVCVHACGGQRLMSNVFLITQSIFTLHCGQTGFLTGPGAHEFNLASEC